MIDVEIVDAPDEVAEQASILMAERQVSLQLEFR